ncbi:DUF1521 domain-containing protein [uncultured Sphingomonas sp.]|uniref:DUF1521 domain-containing protein n=1 Tax=uncultured Sphingomonas sp. TaxID=158754 RepID=UPI0035CCA575
MTMNGAALALNPALNAALAPIRDGLWLQMAAGVLAHGVNRLGAGPFAQGMLPATVSLTAMGTGGTTQARALASFAATTTGAHTASVDLGDGYSLRIDERNSEMTILNAKTGESTRIWGDPHVDIDGKHAFDFWGTTTFQLENGTKLTINTEQWNGNPNMYVASQVVITKGANSVVVDGISQNKLGDLSVTVGRQGRALDTAHRDGFMLYENATGSGWRAEHGAVATQTDLNATAIGAEYGPGSTTPSLGEFSRFINAFLFTGRIDFTGIDTARLIQTDADTGKATAARPRTAGGR